jgi:hypothetical protein
MASTTPSTGQLEQADRLDQVADELEAAARHARLSAAHFRSAEVPRGAAHALAAWGHLHRAGVTLGAVAEAHADRSVADGPERTNAGPQSGPAP